MHLRSLLARRPLAQLLTTATTRRAAPPSRGHKTAARTRRSLKIPPHDSFLPSRTAPCPAHGETIIYNPPSSEAPPAHTPFLFLPPNDPRRRAAPLGGGARAETTTESLPPAMRYKRRTARYNLTEADVQEIRRLRAEDPITWSVGKLAARFACSEVFVKIVAPASREHHAWLRGLLERRMARWGPKKVQAREDRKRRAEMVYRGAL